MTLREAKRAIHGDDSGSVYEPDPKIGELNNARRKADWDAAQDRIIGDDVSSVWICGDIEIPMCKERGCEHAGDFLCDWPMGRGKTCDLPLCTRHAREIGEDRHLCPIHHPMFVKNAGASRINSWPPKR